MEFKTVAFYIPRGHSNQGKSMSFRYWVSHKKGSAFDQHTSVFWNFFSILNKAYPNLNLDTNIAEIHSKLSELRYSKVEDSKFTSQIF